MPSNVAGIILAGGQSRRMGREKPLLDLGGRPVIAWIAEVLGQVFPEVIVVTNKPDQYAWLGLRTVSDVIKGQGPLAGIHAGLLAISRPQAVVVGGDMPFIRQEPLRRLCELGSGYDIAVPSWRGLPEYMHALYSRECIPHIEDCLASGERRIIALRDRVQEIVIPAEKLTSVPEEIFFNINKPADYLLAQRIARRRLADDTDYRPGGSLQ
ncbi:MAG: molybdenum cofactor guanylyltransferase [Firmicutes bacterium]|nr:molybdenum cofactor guanylyltransferase [Bacillota bacterium]